MIDSNDPIHRIRGVKREAKRIIKLLSEYHDPYRYMAFNKKTKKYILRKFKRR